MHKRIKGTHLVVHQKRPAWALVNDIGFQIIQLLDGNRSVQDIVRVLQKRFEVDQTTLEKDVGDFLKSFAQAGLLEARTALTGSAGLGFQTLFLHITERCNLSCSHCYINGRAGSGTTEADEGDILRFLDDFFTDGGQRVIISGGEPLMRRDLLEKILKSNAGAAYSLLTNAVLIDETLAALIARHNVSVQISIDGSCARVHDGIRGIGSFDGALRGIRLLQRAGLQQRINSCTTMMHRNAGDLKNIIGLAKKLEIPYVRFIPLLKEGRACRNWEDLHRGISVRRYEEFYDYVLEQAPHEYPEIKISSGLCGFVLDPAQLDQAGHWCPIDRNLVMDTRGNLYPCALLMHTDYRMGSIGACSIQNLKNSPVRTKMIQARDERMQREAECAECLWKNFCQSGCMGLAMHSGGSIWCRDEFCGYRKKLYLRMIHKLTGGTSVACLKGEQPECT